MVSYTAYKLRTPGGQVLQGISVGKLILRFELLLYSDQLGAAAGVLLKLLRCIPRKRQLGQLDELRAGQLQLLIVISRARKIVTKFHNYSYEIVMSPVIVNSYKNGHNSYQIVK